MSRKSEANEVKQRALEFLRKSKYHFLVTLSDDIQLENEDFLMQPDQGNGSIYGHSHQLAVAFAALMSDNPEIREVAELALAILEEDENDIVRQN